MKQRLTEMSNRTIARMYGENSIYSGSSATGKNGFLISAPHNGKDIAMQAKPVAPVSAYEEWYSARNRWHDGGKITPAKIRRVVIMRRQGSSWKECGDAVGVSGGIAKGWVEFLPFDLAV